VIPVVPRGEPTAFDSQVRQPGRQFLTHNSTPTSKEFGRNDYWKKARDDLWEAYSGICAYSCFYMMPEYATVDHFLPKSSHPSEAFEWSNYRLCIRKLNGNKADSTEVIDPFDVKDTWFMLDFPSCLVRSGNELNPVLKKKIDDTIRILKLNEDDSLVQERCDIMVDYAGGNLTLNFLKKRYPFLAVEIERQRLAELAVSVFKTRKSSSGRYI